MKISSKFWQNHKLDYLFLTSEINRFWYTNFHSSQGLIIISPKTKKAVAFLDERYADEAKQKINNCEIKPLKEFINYWKSLKGNIGCEENLSWTIVNKLKKTNSQIKFKNINIQTLRMIKEPYEIAQIKQICQITAKVWEEMQKQIQPNWLETEVEDLIRSEFRKHKVYELAFNSIVSSGLHSHFIHTIAKPIQIQNHLLCDFGGKWKNYCSDFTRVMIFDDKSEINKMWKLVKKLQKKVIKMIRPGIKISTLAKMANKFYLEHKIVQKHSLGHGVGLEVHELPNINSFSEIILKPGMVFTIEPGIYLPKIGGVRIEDIVLVTENGHEVLTEC